MNLNDIQSIVKNKESESLEFKKSTAQLQAAFETLCAFLNGHGGIVLIGVNDHGQLLGQLVSDKTRLAIANEMRKIEPPEQIEIDYIEIKPERHIIALSVKDGVHSPYIYNGRPFQRHESSTELMPQHRYEQLFIQRRQLNHSWESFSEKNISLDNLDENLILSIARVGVERARLPESIFRDKPIEILEKFNLLDDGKPKNAAIVLFCKNKKFQFIQSQLRLARFKGLDKTEFMDSKLIVGNVFYLYEQAISFLNNYLPVSGKITNDGPRRIETASIPYKVLREALVNALCHRDYSLSGGAVSVAIYDDRVEVSSTGSLPYEMTEEYLIQKHRSIPRNPLIAEVFYAYGFIEMWGRGIEDIIEFSKNAGNPEPKFIVTKLDFTVCLPMKEPILTVKQSIRNKKEGTLNIRQQKILKLLREHTILSANEIYTLLLKPSSLRTIKADLTALQEYELVERQGKGTNTVWKIRS
jgi:ATP-dependent DNA helicase RecG